MKSETKDSTNKGVFAINITLKLVNGKIYTMDGKIYEALGVSENRIALLGTTEEIEAAGKETAASIDLQGKSVFPGFIDSHMHFVEYGLCAQMINLEEAGSIEDIIVKSKEYIEKNNRKKGWILGFGWNENRFKNPVMPTKHDLDMISDELPVMITRVCEHIVVVNSKALKLTEATINTAVKGGIFDKDESGELTGVLRENALDWLIDRMPARSVEEIQAAIITAAGDMLRSGITSVHTSDLHSCSFEVMYEAYSRLKEAGRLPLRINEQLYLPSLLQLDAYLSKGYPPGHGDDFFRLGPVKLLTDGCLGARTAAMRKDYSDEFGNLGMYTYEQDELNALVLKAHKEGLQLFIHAIGDGAADASISAIENALDVCPIRHRHIINHFQVGAPDLFLRAAKRGILAAIQPAFVSSDWNMAVKKLGARRLQYSYAWKSMLAYGIRLLGSSDCPVESGNPLYGIFAAVTRKDRTGNPPKGFLPAEKLTVQQALELYTSAGAYGSFEEDRKGFLKEGYLADMVVLSEDPFDADEDRLKDIQVLMTIVDGKIQYGGDDLL
ncbi:MAG: amidohydrolase [Eubacteriales bacterium]|nr:amidohydrolase [Eubacteriales bacterium]